MYKYVRALYQLVSAWCAAGQDIEATLLQEMLIKEYRIPMPLSVDEYRIAQLYMIQVSKREFQARYYMHVHVALWTVS